MKQNEAFLKSTYYRYLVPGMLGILGGTVNVLVDSVLIGNLLGEQGLLAVNLCLPLYLASYTLGSLIASGGATLSAREIGRDNLEGSRGILGLSIVLSLAVSLVFAGLGTALLDPLVNLLSGGVALNGLRQYALIIILSGVPRVLLYIPSFYLRLDGLTVHAMGMLTLMAMLNILLDVWFMYYLKMGLVGAAYANLAATSIACVCGLFILLKKGNNFRLPIRVAKLSNAARVIRMGTPSALNNLATVFRILLINILLLRVTDDLLYPVIFTVVTALSEFSLFILNGIPQTALPLIGVYHVEHANAALRLLLRRQLLTGSIAITVFGALTVWFHGAISTLYGVSANIAIPLSCLAVSLLIGQLNSVMTYYYNSADHVWLANVITLLRVLLLPVVFTLFLSRISLPSVWLFLPLSELFTLLIWLAAVLAVSARKKDCSRMLLLDDALERSGAAIEFSVAADAPAICEASERITDFCAHNQMTPGQTMRVSLALEEIMTIMSEKSFGAEKGSFDVRAFAIDGAIGLRIRCGGKMFNPISLCEVGEDGGRQEQMLGIKMIADMVKQLRYVSTFGVNNFFVRIQ